jgi:hypothetical protein
MARRPQRATVAAKVERWRTDPNGTPTADLGRRLIEGETLTGQDAVDLGVTSGLLSMVLRDLRTAGYRVKVSRVPGRGNAASYRVVGRPAQVLGSLDDDETEGDMLPVLHRSRQVDVERPGVTYPALGSALQVRVLALTDDGLVLHLADEARGVWQVQVLGHVE